MSADAIKNFTKDNQKVSFSAASATAEKQVINGKVLGGHIGIDSRIPSLHFLCGKPRKSNRT